MMNLEEYDETDPISIEMYAKRLIGKTFADVGINAGVRTIWFHKKESQNETEIIPDYEITDLRELPDLLKKL